MNTGAVAGRSFLPYSLEALEFARTVNTSIPGTKMNLKDVLIFQEPATLFLLYAHQVVLGVENYADKGKRRIFVTTSRPLSRMLELGL